MRRSRRGRRWWVVGVGWVVCVGEWWMGKNHILWVYGSVLMLNSWKLFPGDDDDDDDDDDDLGGGTKRAADEDDDEDDDDEVKTDVLV